MEAERELTQQEEAEIREMILYFINVDGDTGVVEICPAEGKRGITIHNKEEAQFFTDNLLDCFQTE